MDIVHSAGTIARVVRVYDKVRCTYGCFHMQSGSGGVFTAYETLNL